MTSLKAILVHTESIQKCQSGLIDTFAPGSLPIPNSVTDVVWSPEDRGLTLTKA
jgi:hypothetical protein